MRFGIIGTGSMGGLFAGYLDDAGEDVCCYDVNEALVDAITNSGLRVERSESEDIVAWPSASTSPSELGVVDVAFVLTKAIDTSDALEGAEPMLDAETTVVTVQNGLRNMEIVGSHVSSRNVLGGYTRLGSNTVRPGQVRQMSTGETVFGGEDHGTASEVASALTDAGIDATAVNDPVPYIWDKQFTNVSIKPVAALSKLRNGPMIEYEETREAMSHLIEEAVDVARAQDIDILATDPVSAVIDRELSEDDFDKKSSILEDVENRRPTEIEHINGAVVQIGEDLGIDTPYNRIVTQLVNGMEYSFMD